MSPVGAQRLERLALEREEPLADRDRGLPRVGQCAARARSDGAAGRVGRLTGRQTSAVVFASASGVARCEGRDTGPCLRRRA